MKKSLLALIFAVALAVPAMAENMWVGGSFGYSSQNDSYYGGDEKYSSTSWEIEPEFGYSLNEKWDIGLDLAYASKQGVNEILGVKIPFTSSVQIDTKEFGIAPFARYHVAQIAGIDVMLKGSIFYASGEAKDTYGDKVDYTAYGVSIAPVISYSINETWSIGATLNFAELSFTHVEFDQYGYKPKADNFGFNLNDGSLINIGFSYHF